MNEIGSVLHYSSRPLSDVPPPVGVSFIGDRGEFRGLAERGAGLELITFGFYRFWLATDIRRHLWSHTSVGGDAPEYTGRGRELLIGFLSAMAILSPIYLAYFLVGIEAERYKAYASVPLFLSFYLFGQFAIYRARRYRLTRTVWRGVRFWMDGSGWAYAARATAWAVLAAITFGAALPWREAALERYKMRHCHYGDLQGRFAGRGWELFKRGWKLWLAVWLPLVLGIAAILFSRFLPPGGGVIVRLLLTIWLFAVPFIYGAFKAIEWRWWISGIRFGGVSLESDLSTDELYGLYWRVIGWFVLLLLLFVVFIVTCSFWIFGFGDLSRLADRLRASTALTAVTGIGYLGFILAVNIVLRVYLLRDVWARVAGSTTVLNLEAVENVAAKGELATALGEGLAGGLDVVGF
jgi:uncharacterized membrane protein YjgN (DUF898 family)